MFDTRVNGEYYGISGYAYSHHMQQWLFQRESEAHEAWLDAGDRRRVTLEMREDFLATWDGESDPWQFFDQRNSVLKPNARVVKQEYGKSSNLDRCIDQKCSGCCYCRDSWLHRPPLREGEVQTITFAHRGWGHRG